MQTNQVSNPANILGSSKQTVKPGELAGAESFGAALSREVAGRGNADLNNANNVNNTGKRPGNDDRPAANDKPDARQPQAADSKPAETKAADKSASKDDAGEESGSESGDAAQSQFSSDMLALVAAINSITGQTAAAAPVEAQDPLAGGAAQDALAAGLQAALDGKTAKDGLNAGATGEAAATIDLADAAKAGTAALQNGELGEELPDFGASLKETANNLAAAIPAPTGPAAHALQQVQAATDKLAPPVGGRGWDQALGQKVVWMVAGEQQSASLTLNPPDLGPLQVVLSVSNSHASATFSAAQPEVRQALEAALPKLRDMLGEAGIQLGQATVNSGSQQQGGSDQQSSRSARSGHGGNSGNGGIGGDGDTQARVSSVRPAAAGVGLVDTFV